MSLKRRIFQPSNLLQTHPLSEYALLLSLPVVYFLYKRSSLYLPRDIARGSLGSLIIYLRAKGGALWCSLWSFWSPSFTSPYATFETPEREDRYWRSTEIAQRELSSSDARFSKPDSTQVWNTRNEKPILYYTPRLLPEYRDKHAESSDDIGWSIKTTTKAFMKWHWLVFPDRPHPSYLQASSLLQRFSNADLREIRRISRLAPATEIKKSGYISHRESHRAKRERIKAGLDPALKPSITYLHLWRTWLQNKSSDLVICFQNDR